MKFIDNMPVGRKLFVAFGLVLTAIAIMGAVVISNLLALENANEARSVENARNRATAQAELLLAKQENAFRGYLLSQDGRYIQQVDLHRSDFRQSLEDLAKDLPASRAAPISQALEANDAWYENVIETRQAGSVQQRAAEADQEGTGGDAGQDYLAPIQTALGHLEDANKVALDAARETQAAAARNALIAVIVGLVGALALALFVGVVATRAIVRPVFATITHMQKLMAGDTSIQVAGDTRRDEFGRMAQAVIAFRDAAIEKVKIEADAASHRSLTEKERQANEAEKAKVAEEDRVALTALGAGLAAMSSGDLTYRFTATVPVRSEQLKTDFNLAITQLQEAMKVVLGNVAGIRSGAGEISQAADDLSRRTEQQAASLEETAAALDQITATVNRTAAGARQVSDVVLSAKGDAEASSKVVRDAVAAMNAIEESSTPMI